MIAYGVQVVAEMLPGWTCWAEEVVTVDERFGLRILGRETNETESLHRAADVR